MAAKVFIAGVPATIISGISISRSSSDTISSATFSTPVDYLSSAQAKAAVIISLSGKSYFAGIITSYSLTYQGKALTLTMNCSNLAYVLSHSLLPLTDDEAALLVYGDDETPAMSGRLTFQDTDVENSKTRVKAGDAVEALISGTGIYHNLYKEVENHEIDDIDYIGLRDVDLPDTCLVFDPGTTRLEVIQAICKELNAIFYIKIAGQYCIAVFDTFDNLNAAEDNDDFTTTISVSDSTHLIKQFTLESVPENDVTRVTEEVLDNISVDEDYIFADSTARDAYFTSNPTELVEGVYVKTNGVIQQYTDSAWGDIIVHAEAIATGASLPYCDKYIDVDPDSDTDIASDAAAQLSEYTVCSERASLDMMGTPASLFNILDLSGLYTDMDISPEMSTWRVTESEITISAGTIRTKCTMVPITISATNSKATGSYSLDELVKTTTNTAINSAAAKMVTITDVDDTEGTVTVKYAGDGAIKVMKDKST